MDRFNLGHLEAMQPRHFRGYLGLFLDFAPGAGVLDIPDPYQGEAKDFDRVLDLTERAAAGLLEAVRRALGPGSPG
jgi:protein-tyrosine phosphatase